MLILYCTNTNSKTVSAPCICNVWLCVLVSSPDNVTHGDQCEPDAGMWGTTADHPAAASIFHYGQKENFFFLSVISQAHNLKTITNQRNT